jgi:hypothetical protein
MITDNNLSDMLGAAESVPLETIRFSDETTVGFQNNHPTDKVSNRSSSHQTSEAEDDNDYDSGSTAGYLGDTESRHSSGYVVQEREKRSSRRHMMRRQQQTTTTTTTTSRKRKNRRGDGCCISDDSPWIERIFSNTPYKVPKEDSISPISIFSRTLKPSSLYRRRSISSPTVAAVGISSRKHFNFD